MPYVYRHIRLDKNEPFYIGISKKDDKYKRAYHKENRNSIWKRITSKSKYKVEIIFEDDNIEFIKEKEVEFIKLYGRIDLNTGVLANMTNGGDGVVGNKLSQEIKEKLRHSHSKICYTIIDEFNNIYETTSANAFAKTHNIHKGHLQDTKPLLDGSRKLNSIKGFTIIKMVNIKTNEIIVENLERNKLIQSKKYNYTIIDFNNDILHNNIFNLEEFCRNNKLLSNKLEATFKEIDYRGRTCKQHRGFKILSRILINK